MAHRRGIYWAPDPLFPAVQIPAGNRDHLEHNRAVLKVLAAIYEKVSQVVNYHHIKCSIPKHPLPLKWDGHIYDIAYVDEDGNLILVEIKVKRKWEIVQL